MLKIAWKVWGQLVSRFGIDKAKGQQLIGNMAETLYDQGMSNHDVCLSLVQMKRVSHLLGIYKALNILFPNTTQATSWVERPNTLAPFNGISPMDYMLEGSLEKITEVHRFLETWCWN